MTLTMFTLNAFYGLALAMNMFIIASGLNLIFGVLRVINFAHGMFYMFGAYITFTVAKSRSEQVTLCHGPSEPDSRFCCSRLSES